MEKEWCIEVLKPKFAQALKNPSDTKTVVWSGFKVSVLLALNFSSSFRVFGVC
jgi:hypothetical protein